VNRAAWLMMLWQHLTCCAACCAVLRNPADMGGRMMTFTYVALLSGLVAWNTPGGADSIMSRISVRNTAQACCCGKWRPSVQADGPLLQSRQASGLWVRAHVVAFTAERYSPKLMLPSAQPTIGTALKEPSACLTPVTAAGLLLVCLPIHCVLCCCL
jgi:hypothetical protein